MKNPVMAVVGATGLVGSTVLDILVERAFPFKELVLFAHPSEAGTRINLKGQDYIVQALSETSWTGGIELAIFAVDDAVSEKFAPLAVAQGCVVVDNSNAWRMNPQVPLLVPEVNPAELSRHRGIIANPNCSTIQAVVALKPLHDQYTIRRIVYNTYQAVSGSGRDGIRELTEGLQGYERCKVYTYPIAGNCIPHIDAFLANLYTKEEMKMVNETKKIFADDSLKITATTVRVPVFFSHCVSINVEFAKSLDLEEAKAILQTAPGVLVQDEPSRNHYPTPLTVQGKDRVYVGRIRRDESVENGLNLWVVADNVRKGAALNAVQIAEMLLG